MPRQKKPRRGGAREGAGRKPILAERCQVSLHLELATANKLRTLAEKSGITFSEYVRATLERHTSTRRRRT